MISPSASPVDLQKEIGRLRRNEGSPEEHAVLKNHVKIFQNRRLPITHHNLLQKKDTQAADRFFLDGLHSPAFEFLTIQINRLANSYQVNIEDNLYIEAFRTMGNFDQRKLQIKLVRQVGDSMVKLMHFPFLRTLLKMTRGAAQSAKLEDFHGFLEKGLDAFSSLQNPKVFFSTIETRELQLLSEIANGKLQRF